MSSGVFTSLASAGKRELVIKRGSGSAEAASVESGDYDALFTITTLNHLQVSGFPELKILSAKIGHLDSLLQLILTRNELSTLPDEIGALAKLKLLDVSNNKIARLPASIYDLKSLHTFIVGHNTLTDASFPKPAANEENVFPNLHHLDIIENQLTILPEFVYQAHSLQELLASDNTIAALEPAIGSLVGLKQLDMRRNKLNSVPFELTICAKLKTLQLEENPISDRRLMKLIAQHGAGKPKAVLDYIASHSTKAAAGSEEKGGGKKGRKKKKGEMREDGGGVKSKPGTGVGGGGGDDSDFEIEFSDSKPQLQIVRPPNFVEVKVTPEARKVRPYVVCAIVRRVDLASESNFAKFIALQTKLHDTVCKRRRAATIATHDLLKLSPPLSFTCHPAEDITLTPLGRSEPMTCRKFIEHLEANKPDKTRGGGGGKKGAAAKQVDPAAAALSKYLQLVNPSEMVALEDSSGAVVSLPPLTNSENTKVETQTTDLFLEVTSSDTLATCKSVMDALVYALCDAGVGVRDDCVLCVEQVRVVEAGDSKLLVLYPSRTDLTKDKFAILRP